MDDSGHLRLGARTIPTPKTVSSRAQANLETRARQPGPTSFNAPTPAHWAAIRAAGDQMMVERFREARAAFSGEIDLQDWDGVPVSVITPANLKHADRAILDLHGGAYLFGGGEVGVSMALQQTEACGCRAYSVDYRMPPEHPYPAAIDDVQAAYRRLLKLYSPDKIVIIGYSAGGGLAGALALKLRDDGDPAPGALILVTPEADLTEAGDSFRACVFPIDFSAINHLYAAGRDLADPYLSPLHGDFTKGYPPTLITTGTRDFFLSSCALMHRKLRQAGIDAELHVWEAMPHGGFDGHCPEDDDLREEVVRFVDKHLA